MQLLLHPKVASDVAEIVEHYEREAGTSLADQFRDELTRALLKAAENPESFGIRHADIRRVNLPRFPYHFLFRITSNAVLILVVRHHRRHPLFGIRRH